MKKITSTLIAIFLIVGISSNAFSQSEEDEDEGTGGNISVEQGDIQVRAYYGFPYVAGALVKAAVASDDSLVNVQARNTNHIGGSVQFMVSEEIGLGVDYTFAKTSLTYDDGFDKYKISLTKHRITALMSYHFAIGEAVDPYFNVGAGYKVNMLKIDDPGYDDSEVVPQAIPVSFRLGIGLNYFFTENIGINAEVGIGGPIAQLGLTFNF